MEADTPILAAEHVSLRFGGVRALTDVSFEVRRGEVAQVHGREALTVDQAECGAPDCSGGARAVGARAAGHPISPFRSLWKRRVLQGLLAVNQETNVHSYVAGR